MYLNAPVPDRTTVIALCFFVLILLLAPRKRGSIEIKAAGDHTNAIPTPGMRPR